MIPTCHSHEAEHHYGKYFGRWMFIVARHFKSHVHRVHLLFQHPSLSIGGMRAYKGRSSNRFPSMLVGKHALLKLMTAVPRILVHATSTTSSARIGQKYGLSGQDEGVERSSSCLHNLSTEYLSNLKAGLSFLKSSIHSSLDSTCTFHSVPVDSPTTRQNRLKLSGSWK